MPTPSGTISLNNVNVELGLAGTTTISMNQANVRALAGVPSGAISMQNLQNKSNRVTANITISSNTVNYTLNTAKVTGYVAGKTDVTFTINSGVVVYSTSTGSYALTVDTSWTTGDTILIVNNGTILGQGGSGGPGGAGNGGAGSPGLNSGGPALLVQRATSINNLNRIAGGGGAGGGSFGLSEADKANVWSYGGGGGGGGVGNGPGGAGGPRVGGRFGAPGNPGGAGNFTSAGGGGGSIGGSGSGGPGGSYGASGSPGESPSGSGTSGGACLSGNSNITWINFGLRNGSIS
jgi:hypothetical protein